MMMDFDINFLKHDLLTLQGLQKDYSGRTIENIIENLKARLKEAGEDV